MTRMDDRQVNLIESVRRDSGLEGRVEKTPPFDCYLGLCIVPGCPGGDLGASSHRRSTARICYMLRGEGLAVQFVYYSAEYLPETVEHLTRRGDHLGGLFPLAVDLGYHAATPMVKGQEPMDVEGGCRYLGLPHCFYDGSGLNADPGLALLQEQGPEAVWEWLEDYWHEMFGRLMANSGVGDA